jgi:hypothetical protein
VKSDREWADDFIADINDRSGLDLGGVEGGQTVTFIVDGTERTRHSSPKWRGRCSEIEIQQELEAEIAAIERRMSVVAVAGNPLIDETGSQDRFLTHRPPMGWWLVHNLIAHPLIGLLPFTSTFKFHDWTSRKLLRG